MADETRGLRIDAGYRMAVTHALLPPMDDKGSFPKSRPGWFGEVMVLGIQARIRLYVHGLRI